MTDATPKPVFDWADLAPLTDAPKTEGYIRGPQIDVEKEIPEPIRKRVEESLTKNLAAKGEDGKIATVWGTVDCKTNAMAKEFARLVKRYGQYRKDGQLTVRVSPKIDDKTTVVRFAAKPLEKRETRRLPGSEQKPTPATQYHAEQKAAAKPATPAARKAADAGSLKAAAETAKK